MPTQNINFQDSEKYFLTERMKKGESSFKKEFFELNKINDANSLLTNGSDLTLFMLICMHVSRA